MAVQEIGPQMVPAMLEQPPDFFHLFMDKKSQFAYARYGQSLLQRTRSVCSLSARIGAHATVVD
jgi:hypothetical protein